MSIDRAISDQQARKILGISARELVYWQQFNVGPRKVAFRTQHGIQRVFLKGEVERLAADPEALAQVKAEYHKRRWAFMKMPSQRKPGRPSGQQQVLAEILDTTMNNQSPPE